MHCFGRITDEIPRIYCEPHDHEVNLVSLNDKPMFFSADYNMICAYCINSYCKIACADPDKYFVESGEGLICPMEPRGCRRILKFGKFEPFL